MTHSDMNARLAHHARTVFVFDDRVVVVLAALPRQRLVVPWGYSAVLDQAPPYQRMAVQLTQGGGALHWPGLGHTITVAQLMFDAVACASSSNARPALVDG
jgi:hypothetical protein